MREHTEVSLRALRAATSAHERRGGLDHDPAPPRLLAAVPAWTSRRSYLAVLRGLAGQPHVAALCRAAQISVDTWLAVAINDAHDADDATGRGMRTSQVVAAERVGRSTRTVRRARAVSVRLGVLVELYRGRELSGEERKALWDQRPGHGQRGLTNVYAVAVCPRRQRGRLSVPRAGRWAIVRPHGQDFVHLPPLGGYSSKTTVDDGFPYAVADAPREAEPAPPALKRRRRRSGIALAYRVLDHRSLELLGGVRPGAAAALFAPFAAGGWTSAALASELRWAADQRGVGTVYEVRSPYAFLKALLDVLEPNAKAYFTRSVLPAAAPIVAEPCGSSTCDGHGWEHVVVDGVEHARACPSCPPSVRGAYA